MNDGEHSCERAHWIVLGLKHMKMKMVLGPPIACEKYGLEHNNNPAEQEVEELEDWCRHTNGFDSDSSAPDLLRGRMVYVDFVNTNGRRWTWTENSGLRLALLKEGRISALIRQAIGWRKSQRSSTNR